MSVEIRASGETVTAYLSGELDHHTARAMREAIDNAVELNMPSRLVLNFKNISFMDSSGIGLIIGRYRLMRVWQGEVQLSGMSKRIEMIVRLSGAERIVTVERREQNAG